MIHHKFDSPAVSFASSSVPVSTAPAASISIYVRLMSIIFILALPMFLLWLLAVFLWSDFRSVGRIIGQFYQDAAEEYSRFS